MDHNIPDVMPDYLSGFSPPRIPVNFARIYVRFIPSIALVRFAWHSTDFARKLLEFR